MTETCSFNLKHYRYCLELAQNNGYVFLTMKDYINKRNNFDDSKKIIILRHDVDHKLALVLNLATIEYNLGITATYFIRIHADYNPFSFDNYLIIKKLLKMNHELGLHYGCDFADLFDEMPEEFFENNKNIFENIINRKVFGVSSHEPGKSKFIICFKEVRNPTRHYLPYRVGDSYGSSYGSRSKNR